MKNSAEETFCVTIDEAVSRLHQGESVASPYLLNVQHLCSFSLPRTRRCNAYE
jgi:hypothetical protein